ncbi:MULTISPECIES: TolC family outer membrane protein [Cedecea]|uniref:Type I secretion outer membrane protein, TolC family n=1 Tax=Cedecea davisae DSM 4568 TaxID=566551 RepID=S3IS36_9ENTR|nr:MULTISPECIES: TolC family outer membrane protein [Cedecea]EPF16568.1 type I secretion outer membrane protein, TolC family [Cedecea davisae DSM 4568]QIX97722.1 TolC family outer membrane protein [Cedecea sp. FDAARGOS_727]STA45243.1 Outer membrane efflux protein BepC precursor [Cedecea davisae]
MAHFYSLSGVIFALICIGASAGGNAAPAPEWAAAPGVAQATSLTLGESILFALDRDPAVSRQAAQLGIGQAQIDQARSAWFPQVSLSGSTGHSSTTDSSGSLKNSAAYGLSLTQLVYDFGKTSSNISQQQSQRESYRYQLMATLTEVAEKTAQTYIEVKRYQALIAAADEGVAALQTVNNMAKLRADAGLSSSSDVLQTQTRIAGMRSTLEQYQAALQSAKARLVVLTGVKAAQYQPLPMKLALEQEPLDNIDYSIIPAVLAAEAMRNSSDYAVDKAKSGHWPTLSLRGGRTRYQSNNNAYWDDQIQLNVDAPIYQGGAVSAQVEQAQGARRIATSQVEQAKFDVLQKASVAMADWSGARGREEAGKLQLDNARRAREVYKNEYKLSKRSLNDLLSVEQDVFQAAWAQINADYDGWLAAVNYAAAVDNLLPLTGIEKNAASKLPELK